ncbi:hypothetical protein Bpfe_014515 [Biomphalaria pfeifferi]|uniref:Uncharacterized protein n=1 Tax=Biomphalaria pfeifferi TaxID=112525 RepID=A0AAD8BK79_BIOPF|nr:hypothetical protein Bpfe_014515 [Biomphalaria pfeifferi]
MEDPVYDFILGSRYVPLGVVNKPYFSLPVGRTTKQKRGSNQQVGSPGRHTDTPSPYCSAKLKPLRTGIDTARKSRVKSYTRTHEGPRNPGSAAKNKQHSPDIDSARMPRGKMNPVLVDSLLPIAPQPPSETNLHLSLTVSGSHDVSQIVTLEGTFFVRTLHPLSGHSSLTLIVSDEIGVSRLLTLVKKCRTLASEASPNEHTCLGRST